MSEYRTTQGRKLEAPKPWPKRYDEIRSYEIELVPADLARELYEALRRQPVVRGQDTDSKEARTLAVQALARYDREVGHNE